MSSKDFICINKKTLPAEEYPNKAFNLKTTISPTITYHATVFKLYCYTTILFNIFYFHTTLYIIFY